MVSANVQNSVRMCFLFVSYLRQYDCNSSIGTLHNYDLNRIYIKLRMMWVCIGISMVMKPWAFPWSWNPALSGEHGNIVTASFYVATLKKRHLSNTWRNVWYFTVVLWGFINVTVSCSMTSKELIILTNLSFPVYNH